MPAGDFPPPKGMRWTDAGGWVPDLPDNWGAIGDKPFKDEMLELKAENARLNDQLAHSGREREAFSREIERLQALLDSIRIELHRPGSREAHLRRVCGLAVADQQSAVDRCEYCGIPAEMGKFECRCTGR